MLLFVDDADGRPVYQQIRDQVVEAIADGRLRDGSRLPATRSLAADLAINFHTVNKAYELLRQQGFIQLHRKTGALVRVAGRRPPPEWGRDLRIKLAEAVAGGMADEEILQLCRDILAGFRADGARRDGFTA